MASATVAADEPSVETSDAKGPPVIPVVMVNFAHWLTHGNVETSALATISACEALFADALVDRAILVIWGRTAFVADITAQSYRSTIDEAISGILRESNWWSSYRAGPAPFNMRGGRADKALQALVSFVAGNPISSEYQIIFLTACRFSECKNYLALWKAVGSDMDASIHSFSLNVVGLDRDDLNDLIVMRNGLSTSRSLSRFIYRTADAGADAIAVVVSVVVDDLAPLLKYGRRIVRGANDNDKDGKAGDRERNKGEDDEIRTGAIMVGGRVSAWRAMMWGETHDAAKFEAVDAFVLAQARAFNMEELVPLEAKLRSLALADRALRSSWTEFVAAVRDFTRFYETIERLKGSSEQKMPPEQKIGKQWFELRTRATCPNVVVGDPPLGVAPVLDRMSVREKKEDGSIEITYARGDAAYDDAAYDEARDAKTLKHAMAPGVSLDMLNRTFQCRSSLGQWADGETFCVLVDYRWSKNDSSAPSSASVVSVDPTRFVTYAAFLEHWVRTVPRSSSALGSYNVALPIATDPNFLARLPLVREQLTRMIYRDASGAAGAAGTANVATVAVKAATGVDMVMGATTTAAPDFPRQHYRIYMAVLRACVLARRDNPTPRSDFVLLLVLNTIRTLVAATENVVDVLGEIYIGVTPPARFPTVWDCVGIALAASDADYANAAELANVASVIDYKRRLWLMIYRRMTRDDFSAAEIRMWSDPTETWGLPTYDSANGRLDDVLSASVTTERVASIFSCSSAAAAAVAATTHADRAATATAATAVATGTTGTTDTTDTAAAAAATAATGGAATASSGGNSGNNGNSSDVKSAVPVPILQALDRTKRARDSIFRVVASLGSVVLSDAFWADFETRYQPFETAMDLDSMPPSLTASDLLETSLLVNFQRSYDSADDCSPPHSVADVCTGFSRRINSLYAHAQATAKGLREFDQRTHETRAFPVLLSGRMTAELNALFASARRGLVTSRDFRAQVLEILGAYARKWIPEDEPEDKETTDVIRNLYVHCLAHDNVLYVRTFRGTDKVSLPYSAPASPTSPYFLQVMGDAQFRHYFYPVTSAPVERTLAWSDSFHPRLAKLALASRGQWFDEYMSRVKSTCGWLDRDDSLADYAKMFFEMFYASS